MHRLVGYLTTLVAVTIGFALAPAAAVIIVEHSGSTDPATEGFTNNSGGLPVLGSAAGNEWHMSGDYNTYYNQYALTSSDLAALNAASTWTYTATMNFLGGDGGTYASHSCPVNS